MHVHQLYESALLLCRHKLRFLNKYGEFWELAFLNIQAYCLRVTGCRIAFAQDQGPAL